MNQFVSCVSCFRWLALYMWRAAGARIRSEDEKLRSNEGFREDLE